MHALSNQNSIGWLKRNLFYKTNDNSDWEPINVRLPYILYYMLPVVINDAPEFQCSDVHKKQNLMRAKWQVACAEISLLPLKGYLDSMVWKQQLQNEILSGLKHEYV